MFTDENGKPSVGFCLWCGRDYYSQDEYEAHTADHMAECPVFQELKDERCMPPVFQVMVEDAGRQSEPAEND